MSKTKNVPTFAFDLIERNWKLASYWWGTRWCPAVDRRTNGGYLIRILKSERAGTTTYDYFETDETGLITLAPRGYAKEYKPGRISGLDAAVEKYSTPAVGRG